MGTRILAFLVVLGTIVVSGTVDQCSVESQDKVTCGSLTEDECGQKNCCYQSNPVEATDPWCYQKASNETLFQGCDPTAIYECIKLEIKIFPDSLLQTAWDAVVRQSITRARTMCRTYEAVTACIGNKFEACKREKNQNMTMLSATFDAFGYMCLSEDGRNDYSTFHPCVTNDTVVKQVDACIQVIKDGLILEENRVDDDEACKVIQDGCECQNRVLRENCGEDSVETQFEMTKRLLMPYISDLHDCTITLASANAAIGTGTTPIPGAAPKTHMSLVLVVILSIYWHLF